MIVLDEIFPIGKTGKPHGINGEMSFYFTSNMLDNEEVEYFVLEIDGIFVPFYIAAYRFKTNETGLLQLEGVTSEEAARELAGKTVYVSKKYLQKVDNEDIMLDYFIGFQVFDAQNNFIGTIKEIDSATENVLLIIEKKEEEFFVPFVEAYIIEMQHERKIITMNLPEGLLDL